MGNWLNADSVEMGMITKRLLVEYNQRPVLTRPQHTFFSDNTSYFEADVDVHIFGYLPRKSFNVLRCAAVTWQTLPPECRGLTLLCPAPGRT